jgi:antitoxin (DNA-binding transcriptional repressor) of toxin-antitoxin stability system
MKFVGVREFKQDAVRYLNEGNEIVVMKRKKPIARMRLKKGCRTSANRW